MKDIIVNLGKVNTLDKAVFGGKAYNLHKLISLKKQLLIPKTLVIPTYVSIEDIISEQKQLIANIKREFNSRTKFAVRSSASSEDGKSSSFAGLYATLLNVDVENIIDAILEVKKSVDSINVKKYKDRKREVGENSMAVIVQPMVDNVEYAGVAFSMHPTENDSRIFSVEMVSGLGDSLVSNKKTPLSIRYNNITKQCRIENTGDDKITEDIYEKIMEKLSLAIQKINHLYNHKPIDVEWAYSDNSIHILQVRPITTIDDNSKKNDILVVAGMTGVGKDFIINRIDTKGVSIIGWGDKLGELLNLDKDFMMSETPHNIILEHQQDVCDYVLKNKPVIAICHPIKDEDGEYTFNLNIEKRLNPCCYIYVKAPPAVIRRRVINRNKMGFRKSKELTINSIRKLQKVEISEIKRLARLQNTKLVIVNNINFVLHGNIRKINNIIDNILRENSNGQE